MTDEKLARSKISAIISIVLVIAVSLAIIVLYSSSGAAISSCVPNGSLTTQSSTNNTGLLSGFAVSCIKVIGPTGAPLVDGVAYYATGQEQLDQGFQNITSFGNCNGFATLANSCVGMVFVFPGTQQLCFWMHNTILSLEQSWISGNGTVTAVYNASPETDYTVCHTGQYVLESGVSSAISVGDRILLNET